MSTSQDNIIIDFGSSTIKSGFCGDKFPKKVISSSSSNKNLKTLEIKKKETKKFDYNNNFNNIEKILNNNGTTYFNFYRLKE